MSKMTAHQILDLTVRPEHRDAVTFGVVKASASATENSRVEPEVTGTSATPVVTVPSTTEDTIMPEPIKPIVESNDTLRAIAREEAAKLQKEQNTEVAIASSIEKHLTAANTAKAEAAVANAAKAEIEKVLAVAKADIEQAKANLIATEQKVVAKDGELTKVNLQVAELQKSVATLQKQIVDANAEKVTASRTEALKGLGLEPVGHRTLARMDDGNFKVADDDFAGFVADMQKVKGTASTQAPVPTPAPVTTPVPTPTQATAAVTPAAPDMSSAEMQQQALASVMSGQGCVPTTGGVSQMAAAFGAGE